MEFHHNIFIVCVTSLRN
jgi:hypothetical protein